MKNEIAHKIPVDRRTEANEINSLQINVLKWKAGEKKIWNRNEILLLCTLACGHTDFALSSYGFECSMFLSFCMGLK